MAGEKILSMPEIRRYGSYHILGRMSPSTLNSFLKSKVFRGAFNYDPSTLTLDGKINDCTGGADISGYMPWPDILEMIMIYKGLEREPFSLKFKKRNGIWVGSYTSNLDSGTASCIARFFDESFIKFKSA